MADLPVERKFAVLCQITRAQHFAWRDAVVQLCPDVDPVAVVDKMWEITGQYTGGSYAKRLDRDQPLAPQVAASVAWSSQCMGEDAVVEIAEGGKEAFLRHRGCPWFEWHQQRDLLAEDRPGCDVWFQATVALINEELGTDLKVETLSSLPDGDDCCLRRFWE